MAKRILIIHNPMAGQRTTAKVNAVMAALRTRGAEVSVRATGFAGEAEQIVRACRGQFDVVAMAGGDGTLMEAVNGLMPADGQKIALIPAGTANVVALELGLPDGADALAQLIIAGQTRRVETAAINGRRFVFTAGAGFDAYVVATVDPVLKRRLGKLSFVHAAIRAMVRYRFERFAVTVDGKAMDAAGVIVMNGRCYGGPFAVAPDNDLFSGKLAVLVLRNAGRVAALRYLAAMVLGRLHTSAGVDYVTNVSRVDIVRPAGAPVQADGDHPGFVPATICAGAGGVNVVC